MSLAVDAEYGFEAEKKHSNSKIRGINEVTKKEERERERERQRERDRERDRKRERETERETERDEEREAERDRERKAIAIRPNNNSENRAVVFTSGSGVDSDPTSRGYKRDS